MLQVKKKERENNESLIRRFSRKIKETGVLKRVRKSRFRQKEKSKLQRKNDALYKNVIRKEIHKLKKLGKFDEENFKKIKKKI